MTTPLDDFDLLLSLVPSLKATGQANAYGLVWRYVADQASPHLAADAGGVAIVARPHLRMGRWTYAASGPCGDTFLRVAGAAPSLRHALEMIAEDFPEILPHLSGIKVSRVWVGGKGYVWVEGESDAERTERT